MAKVWIACIIILAILPYHLIDKHITLHGLLILLLFIGSFCIGAVSIASKITTLHSPSRIDFSATERMLATAGIITVVAMIFDIRDKNVFDLSEAYDLRSDQASALLEGGASASTLGFQIGFLTYPAAYVYLVRAIIFDRQLNIPRIVAFGVLPILITTVAMGGRSPLLYAILISLFSLGSRRLFMRSQYCENLKHRRPRFLVPLIICAILVGAMYYFIAVFFTRAEGLGGASGMFLVAEQLWGVGFQGHGADLMRQILGDGVTYIIFVFGWYIVQGLVMASYIFDNYEGPVQFGVYGIDLISAVVRRVDGLLVARNFDSLQQLGTYGFFPSAFGSLYVDLWYFGISACAIWGALAGLVYQQIKCGRDSRWLLCAPFVTSGIVFSFINTPIGFSNGLVTHMWFIAAFLTARLQSRKPFRRRSESILAQT